MPSGNNYPNNATRRTLQSRNSTPRCIYIGGNGVTVFLPEGNGNTIANGYPVSKAWVAFWVNGMDSLPTETISENVNQKSPTASEHKSHGEIYL